MYGKKEMKEHGAAAGGGAVYGLGLLGAFVFYFQQAHTLVQFLGAFFQAIFWPAFLVYDALKFLHS